MKPTQDKNERLTDKLEAYSRQAQGFRNTKRHPNSHRTLRTAILSAAIPLVAQVSAHAQCMIANTNTGTGTQGGMTYTYIMKYLSSANQCSVSMSNNAIDCLPANGNTSILSASAFSNAANASCTWSCDCGIVITDCNDGLGSGCLTPVEWVFFKAEIVQQHVLLKWETASEINNSGFEILRSTDGKFYRKMAWIPGHGNSHIARAYQWVDRNVRPNQTYYYRLNQLDRDGSNHYSHVLTAAFEDEEYIHVGHVAPNPVKSGQTRMVIQSPFATQAHLALYNSMGSKVTGTLRNLEKGDNFIDLNMRAYVAGTYFVKIEIKGHRWYRKIIVS